MKKAVRVILFLAFAGIFLLSAYNVGDYYYARYQSQKMQDTLIQQVVTIIPPELPKPEEAEEETPLVERAPIAVDFGVLAEQNPDVIGWIYLENTCIHYPIVQSKDNEYYLHRLFDKSWSWPGTPFADYRLKGDFTDFQTIVYGHNMKNGTMFAPLTQYQNQSFYEENPVIWLLTPEGDYKVELIAGLLTDSQGIEKLAIVDQSVAEEFLMKIRENSTFQSEVEATPDDHYLILSTCEYQFENARYALIGKLTPMDS